jgi:hypothetical protein
LTWLSARRSGSHRHLAKIIDSKFNAGRPSGKHHRFLSNLGEIETLDAIPHLNSTRPLSGLASGGRPHASVPILHDRVTVRAEDRRAKQNHAANALRCPRICFSRLGLAGTALGIEQISGNYDVGTDKRWRRSRPQLFISSFDYRPRSHRFR